MGLSLPDTLTKLRRWFVSCAAVVLGLLCTANVSAEAVELNARDAFVEDARLVQNGDWMAAGWIEESLNERRLTLAWDRERINGARTVLDTIGFSPGELALALGSDGILHIVWTSQPYKVGTEADQELWEMTDGTTHATVQYTVLDLESGEQETLPIAVVADPILFATNPVALLHPETGRLSAAWEEGIGTYKSIRAAMQGLDGEFALQALTNTERPGANMEPNLFSGEGPQTLLLWSALEAEGHILFGAQNRGDTSTAWVPLDERLSAQIPANRVPVLGQKHDGSLVALYTDEGAEGTGAVVDALYKADFGRERAASVISKPVAGHDALSPATATDADNAATLYYWQNSGPAELDLRGSWEGGDLETLTTSNELLLEGATLERGDARIPFSGTEAVVHDGHLHFLVWTSVMSGGEGRLHYVRQPL